MASISIGLGTDIAVGAVSIGHSPAKGCMKIASRCDPSPKGRGTYRWAAEANAVVAGSRLWGVS